MLDKMNVLFVFFVCLGLTIALPTVYKLNENRMFEPDLVPVSSTVIPLPVYQVSSGFNVAPSKYDSKIKKPEGPVTLITIHSKKKPIEPLKKSSEETKIKI